MKKILWLLFLFPIFIGKVSASEIYYSEYSEFSPFQEEKVSSSELIQVEEEKRYLWYKEKIIPSNYELYQNNGLFLDDCYETEYSDWSIEKPTITDSKTIESRDKYTYELKKGVRYVHLLNVNGSFYAFRVPEFQVLVDGVDIDYTYTCEGCWTKFEEYIHNGKYNENLSYINNGGNFIVDLGAVYPIDKIKVIFYIFDLGDADKVYTLGYSEDKENVYAVKTHILYFADEYWVNAERREHTIYDEGISSDEWITKNVSYNLDLNQFVNSYEIASEYRYKEKLCRTYETEIEYTQDYSQLPIDDYINKSEYEKTFYRYKMRDKLEIESPLIINNNTFDLNNFVINSSSCYSIEDNIDWNKNDIYQITFLTNNIKVTKDVEVNIHENTIAYLQEQFEKERLKYIEEINHLKESLKKEQEKNYICSTENEKNNQKIQRLDDLNKIYEKKIIELENRISKINKDIAIVIEEKDNQLMLYQQENNNYKTKISDAQKEKLEFIKVVDELNATKKESSQLKEKLNNYILQINGEEKIDLLWLYILILIVFVSYVIIRTRKKSN